jgi:hypothetical protein
VPKTLAYCNDWEVLGLAPKDFHLFEDGKEQQIQSVNIEREPGIVNVGDNLGLHGEGSVTPRGKWSTSDLPRMTGVPMDGHFYLIAYTPPESAEGSCHQIKVKVDRRNSYIYARSQYCNTQHSPSDPLNGTTFGKQLEGYLTSGQTGKIGLSLQTGFFYTDTGAARVDIVLEWNKSSLSPTIGVLGMVYGKDGNLAGRFSDGGCCRSFHPSPQAVALVPTGYETQMDLPSGEYTAKVVLSDGSKFGRAEASLSVDSYDKKEFAISSIALCKRSGDATEAAEEAAAVNLAPKYVPLVSKGVRFTPTGDTRFKKGEPMFAYFEVYEPLLAETPATTVQTRLKVTDTKTGELRIDTGLQSVTSEITPGKTVIPIAEQIAVEKLPVGSYKLEVQASDSAGKSTIWRAANFSVE